MMTSCWHHIDYDLILAVLASHGTCLSNNPKSLFSLLFVTWPNIEELDQLKKDGK